MEADRHLQAAVALLCCWHGQHGAKAVLAADDDDVAAAAVAVLPRFQSQAAAYVGASWDPTVASMMVVGALCSAAVVGV